MGEVRTISSKKANHEAFNVPKTKDKKYFWVELNQIGHDKIDFVFLPVFKPAQKNQFGYLSNTLFIPSNITSMLFLLLYEV
jgi:hypothetical protein